MLHVGKKEDIPPGLEWFDIEHLPTRQRCALVGDDLSVETSSGTMSLGEESTPVLVEGANGVLYTIKLKALRQTYAGGPPQQPGEDPTLIQPLPPV